MKRGLLIGAMVLAMGVVWYSIRPFQSKIDFSTQVKPILNKHCIHCHGGVKQSGGVSMMTRAELLREGDSGVPIIVPGKPNESELYLRLVHEDEEERMPYEAAPLSQDEISILHRWIKEGAEWGKHWAFLPVAQVEIPKTKRLMSNSPSKLADWQEHPLDAFVLEKMSEQQLQPSPMAAPNVLLRRVSLDLIGISTPDHLAQSFLEHPTAEQYEQLVDSLLARAEFGERWASVWMDLARYSDTKGAERDDIRTIWEYRDWLIRAFNDDMPYDQFITEQLAGDLLPNPTDAQYIATGFHRNTVTNDEGGTDNEEFRVAAVVDRVNTTWEALMSSTFACTQCHGHPYDPIRHEEYYEFLAFFNNTRDNDTFGDYPWLRKFSDEQTAKLEDLTAWLKENVSAEQANRTRLFLKTYQPAYYSLQADSLVHADIYDTKYLGLRKDGVGRLEQVNVAGKNELVFRYLAGASEGTWTLRAGHPNGTILASIPVAKTSGWQIQTVPFQSTLEGISDVFIKLEGASTAFEKRPLIQFDWFHFGESLPTTLPESATYQTIYNELLQAPAEHTLIMIENQLDMQRSTHLWDRGNWLAPVEEVKPDVPDIFPDLPEGAPNNRLGVAMWMTEDDHPLTSRTIVNRIWAQFFGVGLSETLEDLGTQGIEPTHPELLDYLAWQLMHEYDWSLKDLMKEIVLSATYRQDSKVTAELVEADPINEYYTRFPRVRLSAEQIRDQSLFVSGLLSDKMYGPSVMPPQPEGVWGTPYNNRKWMESEGEDRHRRALYTYWKRSSPYPSFLTFDAATRQICNARRIETNTPLQALVTLNDPAFMEAAIHLAINNSNNSSIQKQITASYERATGLMITEAKLDVLYQLYSDMYAQYDEDEVEVKLLLKEVEEDYQTATIAALAVVNNAILNLDEFITKS